MANFGAFLTWFLTTMNNFFCTCTQPLRPIYFQKLHPKSFPKHTWAQAGELLITHTKQLQIGSDRSSPPSTRIVTLDDHNKGRLLPTLLPAS